MIHPRRVMTRHPSRPDDSCNDKEALMPIGPVQLLVLGFDEPNFKGEILAELDRLKENEIVRVIDGLAVQGRRGRSDRDKRTDLSDEEAAEPGATVGALDRSRRRRRRRCGGRSRARPRRPGKCRRLPRGGRADGSTRSRTTRGRISCSSTAGRSRFDAVARANGMPIADCSSIRWISSQSA